TEPTPWPPPCPRPPGRTTARRWGSGRCRCRSARTRCRRSRTGRATSGPGSCPPGSGRRRRCPGPACRCSPRDRRPRRRGRGCTARARGRCAGVASPAPGASWGGGGQRFVVVDAWLVRVHRSILPRRLLVATGGLALLLTGRQRPWVALVVGPDGQAEAGQGNAVPEHHDHVAHRLHGQHQLAQAVGDGELARPLERAVGEVEPEG